MKEIWKDIAGYEGLYQISNFGNVKSLERNEHLKNGAIRKRQGRYLRAKKDKDGYLIVVLTKNAKHKDFKVHRLVAMAFIDNPYNYDMVNHIDEQKDNNAVTNLEWCDAKYNANHGTRNKKISQIRSLQEANKRLLNDRIQE